MARGNGPAVTRLLPLGLALVALLAACAPAPAAGQDAALLADARSLYQESQKAAEGAQQAQKLADQSGDEGEVQDAQTKKEWADAVTKKYKYVLGEYLKGGGKESDVTGAADVAEAAQALEPPDVSSDVSSDVSPELVSLRDECVAWVKRAKDADNAAADSYAAAQKSGDEGDQKAAKEKVEYAREVSAKYQEVAKAYVEKGGKEEECFAKGSGGGETEAAAVADVSLLGKCVSWLKKSKEAEAEAVSAAATAEKSGDDGDREEAKKKAEYAQQTEDAHRASLKDYVNSGGDESDCAMKEAEVTPKEESSGGGGKGFSQVKKSVACPKDPFEYCDFYIQGSKDSMPLLNLDKAREDYGSDTPTISGYVKDRKYMGDEESKKRCTVHVRERKETRFFCPASIAEPNGYWPNAGKRFSCSSEGKDYLTPASIQVSYDGSDENRKLLQGRCGIMQFGTVYVFKDNDAVAKLYPGDGDKDYPEDRRCVVFKTGDSEPVCDGKDTEEETDTDTSSPNCPALIPNSDQKDLFPLSKVDRALVERNCSGVKYPPYTHACPIQGACAIRGSSSQCEGTMVTDEAKCGKLATPKECGKAVHVLMPDDYVKKCSEGTFTKSKGSDLQYYCYGQSNNVPECNAMCKDNDWCSNWMLVVPNSADESPKCGKEANYKSQAGCNTDVLTPYYGGCGYCFLMDKDYCGPVCNNFGLDSSKAPSGLSAYWAMHGRTKCSEGKDDPHFVGADGTRFEFNGLPDQSFCLLSDERVHINMKMHGYFDDRLVGASVLKDGKAVRTWMRELGIMWKSEGARGVTRTHALYLRARSGPKRERGEGFLVSAKLDGKELLPMKAGSNRTFTSGLTLAFKGVEKYGPYDMDKYSVSIDGLIDLDLKLRLAHPLLQTPKDAEAHFNIMVESLQHTSQIHGVIGQTYRDGRAVRSLEYRALSALLGHAVAADGTSGLGYLDGNTQDYVSSSVLKPDCKFSAFEG